MREKGKGFDGRDKETEPASNPFDVTATGTRSAKIQVFESFQATPRR